MRTKALIEVRVRIDLGPRSAGGPGEIALLEAVGRSGSLSQAAEELGMSYRRAWALLRDLNQEFGEPVAVSSVGGAGGGGAQLRPLASQLIAAYRAVEAAALEVAVARFEGFVGSASKAASKKSRGLRRPVTKRKPGRRTANSH